MGYVDEEGLKGQLSEFDISVEQIIISTSKLSGAGVCLYDLQSLMFQNVKNKNLSKYTGHYCDFCYMVRSLPGAKSECISSDVEEVIKLAKAYKKPFFHTCHMNLTELVIPVMLNSEIVAIVFIGQCRMENESQQELTLNRVLEFGGDIKKFREYYKQLPELNRSNILAAGLLLDTALKYIIEKQGKQALLKYLKADNSDHISRACWFIDTYFSDNISAKDVTEHLHLNPSYLARLFKRDLGKSITEYLIEVRIQRAKELLQRTQLPIASIAVNVGFTDSNYFCRTFLKIVGVTPKNYRLSCVHP